MVVIDWEWEGYKRARAILQALTPEGQETTERSIRGRELKRLYPRARWAILVGTGEAVPRNRAARRAIARHPLQFTL
jgi:hypothetical protein